MTKPDEPDNGAGLYSPSIEKKYGKPIDEWQELARKHLPAKHMDLVSMLKSEHGMGYGHSNAVAGKGSPVQPTTRRKSNPDCRVPLKLGIPCELTGCPLS